MSSSVSNVVSMMILTSRRSSAVLISWVARMPSTSGILMSIKTTSARPLRVNATASRPLAASPATSMSGTESMSSRKVARSSAWSSASRIRIGTMPPACRSGGDHASLRRIRPGPS
jgi:hypothetical protein